MKEDLKQLIRTFHKTEFFYKSRFFLIPTNLKKIISIIGSRRVGKTYICYQIISELILKENVEKENILYINFEDDRFDFKVENLDLIIQAYGELYPKINFSKCYFFFDEIQEVKDWEKFIRRIYDTYTKNIFITGSSSKLLSKEIATSLRGRSLSFEIYPLSFKEYLDFHNVKVDIYYQKSLFEIKNLFEKYMLGSYPEIIDYNDEFRFKTYQEYLNVMIFKDIIERYNLKNREVLNIFIKKTISNISTEFSINKFHNELKSQGFKISKDLIYELPNYLEDIYLVFFLEKYDSSVLNRSLSSKKVYVNDLGFSKIFKFNENRGRLLENLVFIELKRRSKEIYYHKAKKECDFVIKKGLEIIEAIQVATNMDDIDTRNREVVGLIDAMKTYNLKEGLILTEDEEGVEQHLDKTIRIVPIWRWLLEE